MDIEYTVKIRASQNPPEFKKGLGKGVVAKLVVEFKGATKKDLKSPMFQMQIHEQAEKFLNEHFEVTKKIVRKNHRIIKTTKKK